MSVRVLHIIDRLDGGGAERSLTTLLSAGGTSQVSHAVVALRGDAQTRAAQMTIAYPVFAGPPDDHGYAADWALVRKAVGEFRPDVLHASLFRSTIAAALQPPSVHPLVVTSTGVPWQSPSRPGWKTRVGGLLARRARGWVLRNRAAIVHAVSESVADGVAGTYGVDRQKMVVVPRGRPLPDGVRDAATRTGVRAELGLPDSAVILLAVAREHPAKNLGDAVRAVHRIRRLRDDVHLVVAGSRGEASHELDRLISDLAAGPYVHRLGPRGDVPRLQRAADLSISTSTAEGSPGAVIEAMGCHLPVVAYGIAPLREVLSTHCGVAGVLVPPRDVDGLAAAVVAALDDVAALTAHAEAAYDLFRRRYSIEPVREQMDALYQSLVSLSSDGDPPTSRYSDVHEGPLFRDSR